MFGESDWGAASVMLLCSIAGSDVLISGVIGVLFDLFCFVLFGFGQGAL
jgi:hypothetical protein